MLALLVFALARPWMPARDAPAHSMVLVIDTSLSRAGVPVDRLVDTIGVGGQPAQLLTALEDVLGGSLGDSVGSFNFKAITDRFSELMYDYPFRVPARFALIIRAVVSQEGLALRLDPQFKIIAVAYPYVAKRLLAGDTHEMREKLMEVIFDSDGRLNLERLESLLQVVGKEQAQVGAELIPVAGAGLKLLLSRNGGDLRRRLLLTLIKDDRLDTTDLKNLTGLMRRTFGPARLAKGVLQNLNPLAA